MADLVITPANVLAGSNATKETGLAGETITAGQPVYKAAATQKWMKADTDSGTAEARVAGGIALHGASLDQPLTVQTRGDITLGAGLMALGVAYYLSPNAGGICPVADVLSGDYPCVLGMAKTAAVLALNIQSPGVQLA